jgi:acetyl/propionyl-CoA carboxylase alpha subunit
VFHHVPSFRLTPHRPDVPVTVRSVDGELHEVRPSDFPAQTPRRAAGWAAYPGDADPEDAAGHADGSICTAAVATVAVDGHDRTVTVSIDGFPHHFHVPERSEVWAGEAVSGAAHGDAVVAPFPGSVAEVAVEPGRRVAAGDTCVVIEAMKMLHTLTAPVAGTVAEVTVAVGDQVASQHVLVTFDTEETTP